MSVKLKLMLVAGAVLLGVLAWWGLEESQHERPPAVPIATLDEVLPAAQSPARVEAVPEASAQSAPPSAPVGDRDAKPPSDEALIRGRCVAAETGAPLGDCVVRFTGSAAGSREGEDASFTTGADGCFEIHCAQGEARLDIQSKERVPRTARFDAPQTGQVSDLGDVLLARGFMVRGQVIDEINQPVSQVSVGVRDLPLSLASSVFANSTRHGVSDDQGRFEIEVPLPAGTFPIDLYSSRSVELVSPTRVTVTDSPAGTELVVVVKRLASLSGMVVDEHGVPVRVYLGTTGGGAAWTREDGSFRLYAPSGAPESVQLLCLNNGPCDELDDSRTFTWGMEHIRVVMRRAASVSVLVIDADTGAPVEDYAVRCHLATATSSRDKKPRLNGSHHGGVLTIDQLKRGKNVLRVLPADLTLAMSDEIQFEIGDGMTAPLRVALARLTPLAVRVIDEAGTVVAGTHIELVETRGGDIALDRFLTDPRSDALVASSRTLGLLWSKAVADSHGDATMHGPAAKEIVLRLLGPGHVPFVSEKLVLPVEHSPLEVHVMRGGSLRGHLVGDGVRALETSVELRSQSTSRVMPVRWPVADGSFTASAIAPGEYSIVLWFKNTTRDRVGGSSGWAVLSPPLGTVLVEVGKEISLELDASAYAPASLDLRLILDAHLASTARVRLLAASVDQRGGSRRSAVAWTIGTVLPGPGGELRFEKLPPGEYTVHVAFDGKLAAVIETAPFVIGPGESATRVFEIPSRRLRLRLLAADRTPLANAGCEVATAHMSYELRTDVEGYLVLDPAPLGSVQLTVLGLGVVEVPPMTGDEPEVTREMVFERR